MDSDTKIKVKEFADQKWMQVEFTFEVLAMNDLLVKKSLKEHVEKFTSVKGVYVFEKEFSEVEEIENPLPHIERAFSQIVTIKAMVRDLKTLIAISISYGPSSIEVLEPRKLDINIGEVQDVANMVSGIIHQIAAAGLGGIVATPKSGKDSGHAK
jgi:hypothetical protein